MSKVSKYSWLIFSLVLCYAVEWAGSMFTRSSVSGWYQTLNRPGWNPPDIVFPIVWSILYTMIAYSLWTVIISKKEVSKIHAYVAFGVQLILNFSWSWAFFYMQSPGLGLVNIICLVLALIWNMLAFGRISKVAIWLLVPYLAWVLYATALNIAIYSLN